ncbi:hypothetical protein NP493_44g05008 [Ridgeia piscesae]|uniref:E2F-associated phosphoprotein n=1 Tax=Ridgeia piscesae TaxID=27915 RepID=A0AAD9UJQ6_RIDPI|nr:hypothetical protein NP493_44g05008 [Ridgeia piscesae]
MKHRSHPNCVSGITGGESGSLSNDDLLYDPSIDDQNQRWVDQQRRKYQPLTAVTTTRPLPHSDAVLNCPACMSLLCLDCQRHSLYKNQYRAMFVMNCNVDRSEILRYPKQADKSRRRSRKQAEAATEQGTSDAAYYAVRCSICTTEVGVFDEDEVFHFFNVLSSYT